MEEQFVLKAPGKMISKPDRFARRFDRYCVYAETRVQKKTSGAV